MGKRAEVLLGQVMTTQPNIGGGTHYLVQTTTGVLYLVYADAGSDVTFRKSGDGGFTWTNPTIIFAGTITALSVWYDRWSDISAGLIHLAYAESVTDDVFYRTINTESSDALSTQTTIFAGTSTASPGALSICRARGGNVYCGVYIDIGAEGGFFRLPNANVPNGAWGAARAAIGEGDTTTPGDHWVLVPGWAADNQDMMAFYWDRSASEISRKLYDDSLNSWGETSIATSMTIHSPVTSFPQMAAAVDLTNSRNLLVAWSAVDTLNADLRCWTVTEAAITEVTNVVLNSTDDQGLCGICLDTINSIWWVIYGGESGGAETYSTAINLYCKGSRDSGSTWGPETKLTTTTYNVPWMFTIPRLIFSCPVPPPVVLYNNISADEMLINLSLAQPAARLQIGL
jgi:hypothetical protein